MSRCKIVGVALVWIFSSRPWPEMSLDKGLVLSGHFKFPLQRALMVQHRIRKLRQGTMDTCLLLQGAALPIAHLAHQGRGE